VPHLMQIILTGSKHPSPDTLGPERQVYETSLSRYQRGPRGVNLARLVWAVLGWLRAR